MLELEQEQINTLQNLKNSDISLVSLNGLKTIGKVVEIYDGDTCKIVLYNHQQFEKYNCRLLGVDTPEMKPSLTKENRQDEIRNAYKCRNRLLQLVTNCTCDIDSILSKKEINQLVDKNTKLISIECFEFDKYGRLLVTLFPNDNDELEESANQILVNEHFAKPYDGGTKSPF